MTFSFSSINFSLNSQCQPARVCMGSEENSSCVSTLGGSTGSPGFWALHSQKAVGTVTVYVFQVPNVAAGTFFNTPRAREVLSPWVLIDMQIIAQRWRATCPITLTAVKWPPAQISFPLHCCVGRIGGWGLCCLP